MHLFRTYRFEKDIPVWKAARRKNSKAFIEFLEHLFVKRCPSGHFILILDNASIHKSAASLAALSLDEHRVTVIWLPFYCSEPNPIERFWRYLSKLPEGMDQQEAYQRYLEALGYLYPGPWVFTLDVHP